MVATRASSAPHLRIVARASTWDGARRLKAAGANEVVRPELEGGVEIVRRTLLDLDLPRRTCSATPSSSGARDWTRVERPSAERARMLDDLVAASNDLAMDWVTLTEGSRVAGATIGASRFRADTGASIVAIGRADGITTNPGPDDVLHSGDRIAVIGTPEQVRAAEALMQGESRLSEEPRT